MATFADKVIAFNSALSFSDKLPEGIRMMNPFKENVCALDASAAFYKKYYNDNDNRRFIIGINPGRYGGGVTGVMFTDPKRLRDKCGITIDAPMTHEPSSDYIYRMIEAYGGVREFYSRFYFNSVCPLGFTYINDKGKEVNYNYYDRKDLQELVTPFIIESLKKQIDFGLDTSVVYCMGMDKNYKFLKQLNGQHHFFDTIVPLEHPRFIKQYRAKREDEYIRKYLEAFKM